MTERKRFLAWQLEVDPVRTRQYYQGLEHGAAHNCGCAGCKLFADDPIALLPGELARFLGVVGVDPGKETFLKMLTPLEGHRMLYTGGYFFFGAIRAGNKRTVRLDQMLGTVVDIFEPMGRDFHVCIKPAAYPPPGGIGETLSLQFLSILSLGETGLSSSAVCSQHHYVPRS